MDTSREDAALRWAAARAMVSSGATLTLPQLRARKVVFIPLLIPQPDWDKYHFDS
jgi:hypothetical protein